MAIRLFSLFLVCWCATSATAQEFRLLAWNVESNRPDSAAVSDQVVIADQLTELMRETDSRSQLVALCEVEPKSIQAYQQAVAKGLNSEVDFVSSASGGFRDTDSLLLIVDKHRFRIDEVDEIHRYGGLSANFNVAETDSPEFGALRARSPLAVKLHDLAADCSFWLIVNHLARGEADLRTEQAKMLCKWAKDHNEPIITAGDFNFDYDFRANKGNPAFEAMLESGVWQWLKPDPLADSNWADDRNAPPGTRVDRFPDSILDFVFVANQAREWKGESDILVRAGDFPDNERTSDHRPVIAKFQPSK